MYKKRKAMAIFAATALGGLGALTPVTASAAAPPPKVFRLWEHDDFQGQQLLIKNKNPYFTTDPCSGCDWGPGGDFNDDASSVINRTKFWWVLYTDVKYGGDALCVRPMSHDNNIGDDTEWEDDISSAKRSGTKKPRGCDDITGTEY